MKTLFLLAGIFFLALAVPASADDGVPPPCTCLERPVEARFRDATAIFTGTVQDIVAQDQVTRGRSGRWTKRLIQADLPVAVTLNVDKAYKGVAADKKDFTLHTSLTQYTCAGYPFKKGESYLVFAYRRGDTGTDSAALYSYPPDTFEVGGLCGGTKEIGKASADMDWMQKTAKKEDNAVERVTDTKEKPHDE
jgi:hypothetical protein